MRSSTRTFIFSLLFTGHIQVLEKLFDLRMGFRQLAVRQSAGRNTIVVSWADTILAKIGEAAHYMVQNNGTPIEAQDGAGFSAFTLKNHRAGCMLRAAVQLPRTFSSRQITGNSNY